MSFTPPQAAASPYDIKSARRRLGLSVDQFAAVVCCAGRTLRRWELGTHPIPPDMDLFLALLSDASPVRQWLVDKGMEEWNAWLQEELASGRLKPRDDEYEPPETAAATPKMAPRSRPILSVESRVKA